MHNRNGFNVDDGKQLNIIASVSLICLKNVTMILDGDKQNFVDLVKWPAPRIVHIIAIRRVWGWNRFRNESPSLNA